MTPIPEKHSAVSTRICRGVPKLRTSFLSNQHYLSRKLGSHQSVRAWDPLGFHALTKRLKEQRESRKELLLELTEVHESLKKLKLKESSRELVEAATACREKMEEAERALGAIKIHRYGRESDPDADQVRDGWWEDKWQVAQPDFELEAEQAQDSWWHDKWEDLEELEAEQDRDSFWEKS